MSQTLTITSLFTVLRNHLALARDQKNAAELEKLFGAFILIGDAAIECEDEAVIDLAETLEGAARRALEEHDWKSKLPSETDIQRLLTGHES
ncbi:hypothetical protein HC776_03490 [bacterium]|nr:hypothetical protein [bacterium]